MSKISLKHAVALAVCVILFAVGIPAEIAVQQTMVEKSRYYSGKILMEEGEYTEFKAVLAREDVQIRDLSVYSSADPLVVFIAVVPVDVEFPWGKATQTYYTTELSLGRQALPILAIVVGLIIGTAVRCTWPEKRKGRART